MTHQNRLLLRFATVLHAQLNSNPSAPASIMLPMAAWQRCEVLNRKLLKATQRGWMFAAERVRRDLRQWLVHLRSDVFSIDRDLEPPASTDQRVSISDIYSDLVALHEEFEEVTFDRQGHTLSVTTEAIELEGIYLGPFEIRLNWRNLSKGHSSLYRVIAVDANPAAANESVTHPHVQDESVCEGDGQQSIRKALEQGRLLDFFVIVATLLRTYNSGSPYVSLSDWHGVECSDCGTSVSEDERWTCEKCGTTICEECNYNCFGCDSIYCNECVTRCEGCEEYFCHGCLKQCSCCDAELCQGCLDNKERCSDCDEQELDEESKAQDDSQGGDGNQSADAPLRPDRLGQAALLA